MIRAFGDFRKFGVFGKSASDRGSAGAAAKYYVQIGGRPARPKIFAEIATLQRALISIDYSRFFQKFNKPLLCGSKDDFGVVVGDLSMGEEKLIENIQVVTDKLSNLFGFAMTKQGKSADKDKLFLKVSFMSLFCDEKMGGSSWLDTFYMAYNS